MHCCIDEFCYLGDMVSIDGAAVAVQTRVRKGWKRIRQIVPLFTNNNVSLFMRGLCAKLFVTQQ